MACAKIRSDRGEGVGAVGMEQPDGLPAPFADGRPAGSALCFMMTPAAPVKLHRIRNDELYHYNLGDPIEVLISSEVRGLGMAAPA